MLAPSIGDYQLPDHNPARPVSSYATSAPPEKESHISAWDDKDGPSFSDLLDVINPLQHIPIVNTIYRHLTGDTEGGVADLAGGALYGGPIGLVLAAAGLGIEESTGQAPGDAVYVAMFGDDGKGDRPTNSGTALASNDKAGIVTSDDAPPPPAAAPRESVTTSQTLPEGAVKSGDYLVFGSTAAAGSASPKMASPTVSQSASSQNAAGQPARVRSTAPVASAAPPIPAAKQSGVESLAARQGDYLVFGATPSASPAALSAVSPSSAFAAPPASQQTAAANVTAAVAADASPVQSTLQQAAQRDGKLMPLPQRRAVTPPTALPLPTTGPAAVGGKSQAKVWTGQPADSGTDWFAETVNRNMDKYNSMRGTGAYDAAAQSNAAAATLN